MEFKKEIANNLNQLLEKNYDAEKGYKDAADKVQNTRMKQFLEEQAQLRYDFGHQIKSEIKAFDGEVDKGGSVKGSMHRAWMDLKSAVSSDKEENVMEEVQRGEQSAIEEYNEVINKSNLPATTKDVLTQQRDKIQQAQQSAKNWEIVS
ncbi:PA2169 family four-helix-bundle protein [Mesonia sp. K4-1]|jgi:uncharacterized protein (TIGR02284 family)|uniref:ferritin-like domain-containing protein n=1 Tax=Mesonia sp. K4-1 TaxID=2602760 RepID=UPI0011CAB49A|nr:PA2169 family four-helix-bundle protein [Mesonia sp. K4-1]TXK75629.1 PA2169 family four-helix-bundle protein [Mesonia sp. K4-1]